LFLLKKQLKTRIKKQEGCLKNGFFSTLIIFQFFSTIFPWSHDLERATHYQFDWVCTAHLD